MVCDPHPSLSEFELLDLCERVRHRIGQDIHNQVAQLLTSIAMKSDLLADDVSAHWEPAAAQAREIAKLVRLTQDQLRQVVMGLTAITLDIRGFKSALEELLQKTEASFPVRCSLVYDVVRETQDKEVDLHLYRIAQEAIHNAIKHGKASAIRLTFKTTRDKIRLSILDNGCGFPESGPLEYGVGLRTLRRRARAIGGTLTIRRRPRRGVQVICATRFRSASRPAQPRVTRIYY
jgi:signal transduction histidine kinase